MGDPRIGSKGVKKELTNYSQLEHCLHRIQTEVRLAIRTPRAPVVTIEERYKSQQLFDGIRKKKGVVAIELPSPHTVSHCALQHRERDPKNVLRDV